jgi:hypothetical protein
MKRMLTILILFCAALVQAQTVRLTWDPSPSPAVTNYRIYYGTNSGHYLFVTNAGLVLTQTVVLPHTGHWFFAATASDTNGDESPFSNEAEWDTRPAPPLVHGNTWVRLTPVIERSTNLVDWRSFTGEATWIRATNAQEFFTTRQLEIERVNLINEP